MTKISAPRKESFQFTNKLRNLVRRLAKRVANRYYNVRLSLREEPLQVIFILGHMRTGSSVFCHILNENKEVTGYGETQTTYRSAGDFDELVRKVFWTYHNMKMDEKYVFDKILHEEYLPNPELLQDPRLKFIFIIRDPEEAIPSLIRNFNEVLTDSAKELGIEYQGKRWTEEDALAYYTSALSKLEEYARAIDQKERCIFIRFDWFMGDTDRVFAQLQHFLDLKNPLSENYQVSWRTGAWGIGDSSKYIYTGKLVRERQTKSMDISPEIYKQAKAVFERCSATLNECCTSIYS